MSRFVTGAPVLTLGAVTFLTLVLVFSAMKFEQNMTRDLEVYLPEGEESSHLLLEVREEWSTDTILIIVESRNALDPQRYHQDPRDNITFINTLKEMSALEVAIDPWGQSTDQGEFHTCYQTELGADRGECDGIVFTLSLSTIIKELNSTTPRFVEASEGKLAGATFTGITEGDNEAVNSSGTYAIPDDQNRIDELVNRMGDTAHNYAIDTNDDGIWDTASILFALKYKPKNNDEEQKLRIDQINGWIEGREDPETDMASTGLVVVLHDATKRIYDDLVLMIPLALGIVTLMLLAYHRTWRILVVVAPPVIFSLIWTMGLIQLSGVVLTPMIVAAGPILVGISVDYGLHVGNRIYEFQKEEGLPFRQAVEQGLGTTGKATLLCALTDVIGFMALMISPIEPMRTVGITMIVGVTTSFMLTVIMVPPLMNLVKYRKGEIKAWSKVGRIPVRHAWVILVMIALITAGSLFKIGVMEQNIRGDESAPEEVGSIQKLAQYSEQFEAGQTGILILRGNEQRISGQAELEPTAKDIQVLDTLNATQSQINDIVIINHNDGGQVNVSTVCVINFFKAAYIEFTITDPVSDTEVVTLSGSFWEILHHPFFEDENLAVFDNNPLYTRAQLRKDLIDIFYDSFSNELISMLVTTDATDPTVDFQKTLIYLSMPYINIDDTQLIIERTDEIVDCFNGLPSRTTCDPGLRMENGDISHMTGGPPVTVAINRGIQETQWKTIFLSLFMVLGALFAMFYLASERKLSISTVFRALGFAVATWIPILIVVAWQPMTMTAGSTNVNIFTAMIGTIIIGIGIDNALQISERVREEGVTEEGIARAVEFTGQSLVEATSTTAGGVAAGVMIGLMRTQFVGLQNFFMLIIILILYTLIGGLFVLPAIFKASLDVKERCGGLLPRKRVVRRPGIIGADGELMDPVKPRVPARKPARAPKPEPDDDEAW